MKYNKTSVYIALLLTITLSIVAYNYNLNDYKDKSIENQKKIAQQRYNEFSSELENSLLNFENNLVSIKNNSKFMEYLELKHKRYYLLENLEKSKYSEDYTKELFLSVALNSPDIFQLRYLDPFGKEEIRVDKRKNGTDYLVDKLQDKSNRYYFKESKSLEKDTFWYSYFDLNIEYGKIERPLRPTLRISTPVYTNSIFDGILIVNIDMTNTLNKLFKKNTNLKKVLLDQDEHILFSNDKHLKNWSRYLETEKFSHDNYNELLERQINLHNSENLRLKIYYENEDLNALIAQKRTSLILNILVVDLIVLVIIFMLLKNSYLNHAIKAALKKQEDLFDKVNSFVIMSKTDVDGNITYVTDEFCRLSEYSKEELIGQKHSIIKDNKVDKKVYDELWKTITAGEVFHKKLPIITKSGERRYWDINIYPQLDDNGKIIEYIAYRRDETAQTLLQEHNTILESEIKNRTIELEETVKELNKANEDLSNINEELACTDEELRAQQEELIERQEQIIDLSNAKEQFLSNMSHEIRTPLNGIVGITDILLNDETLKKETVEKLNIIKSSSRILNVVVNDILDYTALKSGKLKIFENEFSLRDMIKNIQNLMKAEFHSKGIDFSVHIDEKIKNVFIGDEFRINQILMNLLSNAKKFTNNGYVKLNVNLISEKDDSTRLRFSVIDTGCGMNEELKSKIFNAFTQNDKSNTSKHRGTGLGLSICKYLVEMMDGKIWFQSNIDKGTMMFFSLKLKNSDNINLTKSMNSNKLLKLKEKKKALLVEDDTVNQVVARTMLEKIGFDVVIANNGLEAVDFVKSHNYDIIFMDIQMPIMNGYDATLKIKEFNQVTPIVALSAGALQEDIHKSHEVGMNMHIVKPIVISKINNVISKFFELNTEGFDDNEDKILIKEKTQFKSKIINKEKLLEIFGDEGSIKELLELFKDSYNDYKEYLNDNNDVEIIKNYVHKLKGASGNLKFSVIHDLCKDYEVNSNKSVIIRNLKENLKSLLVEIDDF